MNTVDHEQRGVGYACSSTVNELLPDHCLVIDGMMCQRNCGSTVEMALLSVPGVIKVIVSFQNKEAKIWGAASSSMLIDAVESVGFDARTVSDFSHSKLQRTIVSKITEGKAERKGELTSNADKCLNFTVAQMNVTGMSCTSCVRSLEGGLLLLEGVRSVRVALLAAKAEINYDSRIISAITITESISRLGYKAEIQSIRKEGDGAANKELMFCVSGMSCANCAAKIEKTIAGRPGVVDVGVSSITNKARVIVDGDFKGALGPRDVIELVEALGFQCELVSGGGLLEGSTHAGSSDFLVWSKLLFAAVALGVPVMILHMSSTCFSTIKKFTMQPAACRGGVTLGQIVMVLLNVPLQFGVGYRFYRSAFLGALHGSFGMDCLVVTGTTVTFIYSIVQLSYACHSGVPTTHVFFEASGMLLMFVTFGKFIESYAKGKTVSAITNLLKMQPSHALLVVSRGNLCQSTHADRVSMVPTLSSFPTPSTHSSQTKSYGAIGTDGTKSRPNAFGNERNKNEHELSLSCTLPVTGDARLRTNSVGHCTYVTSSPSPSSFSPSASPSSDKVRVISLPKPIVVRAEQKGEVLREIAVDLVQKGDVLKILPGARIPTDGNIIAGTAYIDESMITGESVPTLHVVGDTVFGSTVNQQSTIYISATAIGSEGALAQIVRMVESAQMNKAPVQAYADRIASYFTPMVLCLSLITFVSWAMLAWMHKIPREWFADEYGDPLLFAMLFAISVVVISCPCALGLATPTAIMVGTSVGAFNGILIKGGVAFETAHRINTIIFDKTGTLTVGKPIVTDEVPFSPALNHCLYSSDSDDTSQETKCDKMLRLAATAEQASEHPLAKAILDLARNRGLLLENLQPSAFESTTGGGVRCVANEGVILIGNRSFLEGHEVHLSSVIDSSMWNIEVQGKTAVCVALESEVLGVLGIADVPKPESLLAITALRSMGVDVWMVTGDNKTTAEAIADQFDIPKDRIISGAMPQDKVAKVLELQREGRSVAMVGDGVNDSPALAAADLGIAIGAGTHVAIEAADMVLVRSNLLDVVVALDLAQVVFRRIKINFMFALLYNILAIPFAAGVWFPYTHMQVPPQYAGLSMAMSSISVVASSMALKLYNRPSIINQPLDYECRDTNSVTKGMRVKKNLEMGDIIQVARGSGVFNGTKRRLSMWQGTWLQNFWGAKRSAGLTYKKLPSDDLGGELGVDEWNEGVSTWSMRTSGPSSLV